MRAVFKKAVLSAELSAIASIARKKGEMPILSYALLTAGDGGIMSMASTDSYVYSLRQFDAVSVTEPGQCLLPVNKAEEWLACVHADEIEMKTDGNVVILIEETDSTRLPSMDVKDFPAMPDDKVQHVATLDLADLKHIAWSVHNAGGRAELEYIYIEIDGPDLIAVSMNGYQIGKVRLAADIAQIPEWPTIPIHGSHVDLVARLGECRLGVSERGLHFNTETSRTRIVKATYKTPPWQRALSMHPIVGSCSVIREELKNCVQKSHILRGLKEDYVRVTLQIAAGCLSVSAQAEKTPSAFGNRLAAKINGEFPPITLGTDALLRFFGLPDDSLLKMESSGSSTAIKMNAGNVDYWFLPFHRPSEKALAS